jgi:diguanylate cyclase (GGDEF)-like protein
MSIKSEYTEPLSIAYDVLYRIAKEEGNTRAALDYHEQFMAADKGHLNDITARTLAYQMVRQQVEDKKIQLFDLSRRNQILQLQQELDREAVKTSRTYIVLLLFLLASIGFLLYRLRRSQLRFMHLARRDGLTGICNRQHFVEEATQALRYSAKSSRSACLILIDLDHFKTINDTHGHAVGDHVLKRTVAVCQRYLRSRDVFGRLGGEEFGILFPECGAEQALARAEEIRQAIAEVPLDRDAGHVMVTASLGVASAERSGYNLHRLMVDADDALYRAKREGRNRVATASSASSGRAPGDLEISYAGELG